MSGRRRARRRRERRQAKQSAASRPFTVTTRIALAAGGLLAVLAGAFLLVQGSRQNEARLARVAGILMVLGVVALVVAGIGRL